jgi:YVTN family beta-propeller protein
MPAAILHELNFHFEPVGLRSRPPKSPRLRRRRYTNLGPGALGVIVGAICVSGLGLPVCKAQIETDAYITSFGSGTVSVIDTKTYTLVGPTLSAGGFPVGVGITPDGRFAYIANEENNGTVSVIDAGQKSVLPGSINVGSFPIGVGATPDGRFVYVANGNDSVSVIDTTNNSAPIATASGGSEPFGVGVTPNGQFAR